MADFKDGDLVDEGALRAEHALLDGERVLVHTPAKEPRERAIELRIRVAIASQGVMILKHSVEACHACGVRPRPHTGLGKGTADLFCIVPPFGRVLFIEVKRPSTRNRKRDEHQRVRAACVRRHGGVSGVATSEEEALALLEEARRPYALLASAIRVIHGGPR